MQLYGLFTYLQLASQLCLVPTLLEIRHWRFKQVDNYKGMNLEADKSRKLSLWCEHEKIELTRTK